MHGRYKMKKMFFLLLVILVIVACSDDTSTNSKNESSASSIVGWRSAGFTPVVSTQRGGGLQKVTHSGSWLVLMDAWTSPVEGKSETWTTLTYSPRLFISKIGTNLWDTIVPPTSAYVKQLYADSTGVYVGTSMTGQVFMYSPEKREWRELNVVKRRDSAWSSVFGIQRFKGNLNIIRTT